jgi:hypothetical protein
LLTYTNTYEQGPGRVQRAIRAIFAAEPDNAFTTAELCERVYGNRVEKKHRIAVIRAASKLPELAHHSGESLGNQLVFYDPLNLGSYAMARLKLDNFNHYRNRDHRLVDWQKGTTICARS